MNNKHEIPQPNPEVYRAAAEIIQIEQSNYSCNAVELAAIQLGMGQEARELHLAQYQAMFGDAKAPSVIFRHGEWCLGGNLARQAGHPFWVEPFSEDRKQYRITALLLMADICENPIQ